MTNFNIGTIFAIESGIPRFEEIEKIKLSKHAEKIVYLKRWRIFSDLKESNEIKDYLFNKKKQLINELEDIVKDDRFFSNLLWLNKNFNSIRKIFRQNFHNSKQQIRVELRKLSHVDSFEILSNLVDEIDQLKDIRVLESRLDEIYFEIIEKFADSKTKSKYLELKKNIYYETRNLRMGLIDSKVDTVSNSDIKFRILTLKEDNFAKEAIVNVNPDLVIINFLNKINHLFENLQILFSEIANEQNVLIDYDYFK
jgi:hypothetical protein